MGMRITKKTLRNLIREAVRKQLFESDEEPKLAFLRMKELGDEYELEFYLIDVLGPELFEELIDILNDSDSFEDFYKKVGSNKRDPKSFKVISGNKFNLQPGVAKDLYYNVYGAGGAESAEEILNLKKEYDKLRKRFKVVDASNEADRAYGRSTKNVVDTKTGKIVSITTNRNGSLGT